MSKPSSTAVSETRSLAVAAVVVTHERRDLLRECLLALEVQTRPVEGVLVIDTASADGTGDMVRAEFPGAQYVYLTDNVGGAGGFLEGMSRAHAQGFDWLWLMDDDTIATPTALAELLRPLDEPNGLPTPQVLASRVVWTDQRLHPKNFPAPRLDESSNDHFVEAVGQGLLPIRLASFVSVLISRPAIERHGLPDARYFMWGDDGEYTARILKDGVGYTVPASIVNHKTAALSSVHLDRSGRYYYEVRNKLWQMRSDSFTSREKIHLLIATLMGVWIFLGHNRLRHGSLPLLARAVRDGLRG